MIRVESELSRPNCPTREEVSPSVAGNVENRADPENAVLNNILAFPTQGKRTKNRKYANKTDVIVRGGVEYKINQGGEGVFGRIVHRAIDELNACIWLWGRVYALRFDLHHKGIHRTDNQWVSKFFKNLKRRLNRTYGMMDIGYLWVREQERAKSQHYHAMIYLDGDKIRHGAKLTQIITDTWRTINPANTAYFPTHQNYFVRKGDDKARQDLVYRASYLAKVRGKGYRAKTTNDFFSSNLRRLQLP